MWDQFSPTPSHVAYLSLSLFLIVYALFSQYIRNHLHLSEPPLAVLYGIILGPAVLSILIPKQWGVKDEDDEIVQEMTRVIVAIQCFAVGIELPKEYFKRHWKSVLYFLGPIMAFSWAITALFAYFIFKTSIPAALIIGACLSPTDPVLAASVLAKSHFSERVPSRLKHLLSAESACNDGVSFPFLYIGIVALKSTNAGEALKNFVLITILWQCIVGLTLGIVIGHCANKLLRFSDNNNAISKPSFVVFYLLLALLCVGVGSTLGSDDFLVAFGAGVGFGHDGWFSKKTHELPFPAILDMMLNSALFVFFGALIPWKEFVPRDITPNCGVWQLVLFLILVLLFRRIPIVLAMKRFVPDIRTYREALFCGHFGPMGVGALFLAMEAREELEPPASFPYGKGHRSASYSDLDQAIALVWPVVCFVVVGSTFVHGLSTVAISVGGSFARKRGERAPLLGQETDGLEAMDHEDGNGDSEPEVSGSDC
ncbi:Na(+)/H(+) antiporter-like protein [Mollisia scopiformis]|uniref:Na(+)/H(+) antiporter-like protein n=1 Tax=Mollisia scopiformis TaxID=149040 RepID=A0A194XWE7_MOLSC|nr:Na(+)/H(+) antiporter-like protein [Mollisia scopiformis]KUJ24553.1 Na(+)/H(+) antiporter-like protein [Mollisia scopiformis]